VNYTTSSRTTRTNLDKITLGVFLDMKAGRRLKKKAGMIDEVFLRGPKYD
jgi:hypothetical protein